MQGCRVESCSERAARSLALTRKRVKQGLSDEARSQGVAGCCQGTLGHHAKFQTGLASLIGLAFASFIILDVFHNLAYSLGCTTTSNVSEVLSGNRASS